jgi:uncharacterized OsmC-like protein
MGLGFNGGELLLLAIGGCYCNDIFREAAKRGMPIKSVHVDVEAALNLSVTRQASLVWPIR